MKHRILIQIFALAALLPLALSGCDKGGTAGGGDSKEDVAAKADHHYAVAMTGVVWGGCKSSVREAFSKVPGFVAIDFARGDVPGQQKILLAANNGEITQEQLVESLGDHAGRYVVEGVAKE